MDEDLSTKTLETDGEIQSKKVDGSKFNSCEEGKKLKEESKNGCVTGNIENGDVQTIENKENSKESGLEKPLIEEKASEKDLKNSSLITNENEPNSEDQGSAKGNINDVDKILNANDTSLSGAASEINDEENKDNETKKDENKDNKAKNDEENKDNEASAVDSEELDGEELEKEKLKDDKEQLQDQTSSNKKLPLFSESEESDNETSGGKWEAKNIVLYSQEEKNFYDKNKKRIQNDIKKSIVCSSCNKNISTVSRSEIFTHPILGVTTCKKCSKFYGKGDFKQDSEGYDEYCRWCGNGGDLLLCDKCTNGFCKACVRRNFGRGGVKDILNKDIWHCYVCLVEPLMNLRALHRAVLENLRDKIDDKISPRMKNDLSLKRFSPSSKKAIKSPAKGMTHSEDIKGLLLLFQTELNKIEKRNDSKQKISDLKFNRRLVRLIDLMQQNFKKVKDEIMEKIGDNYEIESSNSEEVMDDEKLVKKGKVTKKVKKQDNSDNEMEEEENSKEVKTLDSKRKLAKEKSEEKSDNDEENDDQSEDSSKSSEVEEDGKSDAQSQRSSSQQKSLKVRSDLFSVSKKEKSKKSQRTNVKKLELPSDSENDSLPSLTVEAIDVDSENSEENLKRRSTGKKKPSPKETKDKKDSKALKSTPKRQSKTKKQEIMCIDLNSDLEEESSEKSNSNKRTNLKRKRSIQSTVSSKRNRRK